jgi:phosphate transport system substrate-binding protein
MAQKNETPILVLSLLITLGILGGGYWWFTHQGKVPSDNQSSPPTPPSQTQLPAPPSPGIPAAFAPPTSVASGTVVRIDGSTSMVQINQALKNAFEQQFPGTKVVTGAGGSDKGIGDLLAGKVEIAAISRPLTPQEQAQGLVAIPVAKDAIAIVVGEKNPFRTGLNQAQVAGIFQGQITNWSVLGGNPGTIRVINRPEGSGTRKAFQELVLKVGSFGNTPNITTLPRDATTPLLQALGADGIGYATYAQVAKQRTVRTVAVDGLTPEAATYPYQRTLYYVYKQPANGAAQAFLGYAASPLGQQIISTANAH